MIILQFRGMKSRYYIITYQAITRLFLDNSESRVRSLSLQSTGKFGYRFAILN